MQETAINQEANTSAITKRKNLNSILNNLVKQKELEANLQNLSVNNNLVDDKNNVKIILENVDGNSAGVFQTVSKPSDENEDEPMKLQVGHFPYNRSKAWKGNQRFEIINISS